MSKDDETRLVVQLKYGDTEAYRQLLDNHLPAVSRYVARMMGNANETEDITQEVFFRLWHKSGNFNPTKARLSTWLHQIAHNLCIDHFRKHQPDDMLDPDELTGGTEPAGELSQRRCALNIEQAIQSLPERQRSAIVMCHYQGQSNKEAAAILQVSVDALESLLSRGRKRLRILLEGEMS